MATISELLNQKLVKQLGANPSKSNQSHNRTIMSMDIDEVKLKNALVHQAETIRRDSEEEIMDDIFGDDELISGSGKGSKLMYDHPDVGGLEVVVDIDHLIPDMSDEKYRTTVRLIEEMSEVNDKKGTLNAFTELKKLAENDELNVLYVLFRKARLFDFSHEYTRELLVSLVANLCAYNLKGRALLKGILNQSTVNEHNELAIRSAGFIRAKEVLPEIFLNAKKEDNHELMIVGLQAVINMRDTSAAIEFLPIISNMPDTNNKLIGEAIKLSKGFDVFDDEFIKPLYEALTQCTKRFLRPIFSTGLKAFGARAIPTLSGFMRKMEDSFHVRSAAKIIGGIRSPLASETLRELFKQLPHRQAEIIDGLAHTKDPDNLPLMLDCLRSTKFPHVKRTCITSIAAFGNVAYAQSLKQYLYDQDAQLEVIYSLMRLGDREAEDMYFDKMLNGTPQEQFRLENFTALLPPKELLKVAKKALTLSDMDAVILLSSLYRPNVLPKEVGPLLKELLNRNPLPAVPVRLAIYKIIGKFAGSEKEVLGINVLQKALQTEDPKVKRELENIISTIRRGPSGEVGLH